jgi:hypothetical protein
MFSYGRRSGGICIIREIVAEMQEAVWISLAYTRSRGGSGSGTASSNARV